VSGVGELVKEVKALVIKVKPLANKVKYLANQIDKLDQEVDSLGYRVERLSREASDLAKWKKDADNRLKKPVGQAMPFLVLEFIKIVKRLAGLAKDYAIKAGELSK
jgi:uncharacterized protein YoxC